LQQPIGFIGLGIMGKPMANNLLSKGNRLVLFNRSSRGVATLMANHNAVAADSPAAVAAQCKIIFLMLPDGPDVEKVISGERGIVRSVQPGTIVVDMSSVLPAISRRMSQTLIEAEARYVDAPVSGGEPGAVAGTLAIMCGGGESDIETVKSLLLQMGSSVTRVGDIGAGQAAKLVNQVLVALHLEAMSEAFHFAASLSVDPETVFHAIRNGLAGSNVLNAKVSKIARKDFAPGFKIRLHLKDLNNALTAASESGISLPSTESVRQKLATLVEQGLGELDHSALFQPPVTGGPRQ
jgi:2-hydroxy-3-oxopropionate reductase